MVTHTGNNNTTTAATSTPLSTNNYIIPSFKMNLPQNLVHPIDLWTKQDVQKWIEYCIDEYSLGDVNLNDFEMNGKALLLLNEDSFKQRSARSGDILHKALQQHSATLKSLNCQPFPYQFWSHFGLLPPSSTRHFNIPLPPPPPLPIPPLHLNMACMHPAFNYMSNRPEIMSKSSVISHRMDYNNPQQSIRTREISASSSSSTSSVKVPHNKTDILLPVSELKREIPSPITQPISISTPVKQECIDDEDIDIEQHETVPTPPITPQLNSSIPFKIHSESFSRIKQQPNDVTNTRQIRYYHDRIDFHGDILMKPPAAKNCRILWEFLYILLEDSVYESVIRWENREKMIFRIIQADKLAALWGLQKNRLSMTYEKLSRGMRYYYSNNIISKEQSKRLLYRFMRSPDEIRKSMKRNGGTTNMIYSTLNKKSSFLFQTKTNSHDQETNLDNHEELIPAYFSNQSSTQIHNQFLQLFSAYSPACTSMITNGNLANNLLFATRNGTNNSSFDTKSGPLLTSISKSDRSSSSSPDSYDSSRDRTSDSEKQHCSPSQSLSSSTSASSYSTSTKRKQAIPISLTTRLSHGHIVDQPLNLAVHKEEETISECKKQKMIHTSSIV